jgi:hypothetical protein
VVVAVLLTKQAVVVQLAVQVVAVMAGLAVVALLELLTQAVALVEAEIGLVRLLDCKADQVLSSFGMRDKEK